jgi:hypothetical protein
MFVKRIEYQVQRHNYFPLLDPLVISYSSTWEDNSQELREDS